MTRTFGVFLRATALDPASGNLLVSADGSTFGRLEKPALNRGGRSGFPTGNSSLPLFSWLNTRSQSL